MPYEHHGEGRLYNGETVAGGAGGERASSQPVDEALTPYQPMQCHYVLDERHIEADDLPSRNLVTAVVRLERSRSESDLIPVSKMVGECLRSPAEDGLRQVFADSRTPASIAAVWGLSEYSSTARGRST